MRRWMALFTFVSTPLMAQSLPSLSRFQAEIREYNYFSGSPATFASICIHDECLSAVAGHTDYTRKQTVDAFSLNSVGSLSKYLTAILAMRLVEQDYLKLEDSLASYFPEYAHWEGVTIRNLLEHSSGIPDYLFTEAGTKRTLFGVFDWHQKVWRPNEIIQLIQKEAAIFPVGTKVEYNNTNFILLGMVLEKVTRRSMDALLEREIFAPHGMRDTYHTLPDSQKKRRVSGYLPIEIPLPDWFFNLIAHKVDKKGTYVDTTQIFDPSLTWSAGAVVSTAADLSRLTKGLFSGKILNESSLQKMQAFRMGTVLGMPFEYGLGLMRQPSAYGPLLGHGGLTPGYHALSNYLVDRDQVITLMQNIAPAQANTLYYDLVDQVQEEFAEELFIPEADMQADVLESRSVHFRVRGKLLSAADPVSFFSPSFGYLKIFGTKVEEGLYQTFQTLVEQKTDKLILRASSNPFPLYSLGTSADKGSPFLELRLKRAVLLAEGLGRFELEGSEGKLEAYQGRILRQGTERKFCLEKVLDEVRVAKFQIQGQDLSPGQSVKFAGNLPLRKAEPKDLDPKFGTENWTLCEK